MNLRQVKILLKKNRETLKNRFYVKEIGVFGSYTDGSETPGSDIDILVSFEHDHKDFFNFIRLKYFLEDLFGTEVDLVMKDAVKPGLKKRILNQVEYV